MRVTNQELFDILLKYDRLRNSQLKRATEELSSGKSLLSPSDNPVDFARKLRFQRFVDSIKRFNRNIDLTNSILSTGETALNSTVNVLQEARVKIVQVLNTGTLNGDDAKVLADYFRKVSSYVVNMGNTRVGDSYIFGGVKTQTSPFSSDGTYNGETVETTVPIANGVEVNTNFNGLKYFGVNKVSNKITVVEVLNKIADILESGDLSQLHTVTLDVDLGDGVQPLKLLDAFDKGLSKIMAYRSILGSKEKIAENLKMQNEAIALHFKELQSKLEDADYASVISEYEKAKTAYQALLASINQTQNLSLLNYFVK